MNYEEKYKEALKVIESLYNVVRYQSSSDALLTCQTVEKAFPELCESKDERIRKAIIEFFESQDDNTTYSLVPKKDILAWLEKQYETENENDTDFTIYHPLKNGNGKYECIPYSFYGSLTSFSEDEDLINFLRNCFYTEKECKEWIEKQGDYNRLVEEIKKRKELISKEKEKVTSTNDKLSLGGRIAILEELLAFTDKKQDEQKLTPKFKIGDTIHKIGENTVFPRTIEKIEDGDYVCNNSHSFINIKFQDDYELVEQKHTWSEEDDIRLNQLIGFIQKYGLQYYASIDKVIDWLKSLKPNHWKPNKEQMEALKIAIMCRTMPWEQLGTLYNDLKNL